MKKQKHGNSTKYVDQKELVAKMKLLLDLNRQGVLTDVHTLDKMNILFKDHTK